MTSKIARPRIAIVHDWLIGGGAEQVVLGLHRMFPDAPIYTSYCTDEWRQLLGNKVVTGPLQHWPFARIRKFIPYLRILWFTRLRLDKYDIVISSSGAEAKGIRVPKGTLHINYCHAPTHYYWSRYEQYLQHPGFGPFDPIARLGLRLLVGPLRRWDLAAAQRPDIMIANSTYTQQQIRTYYKRSSVVIHPPVDTERFASIPSVNRKGYVIAGRQTPYKQIDLAVRACTQLNVPLTVIGNGPDHKRLVELAGPSVQFLTNVPYAQLPQLFASAKAFIFPGIDDFGIVAVEAMAAGTPVIAYRGGGALDYIEPGKTGLFFDKKETASLCKAITSFHDDFDHVYIRKSATSFSVLAFKARLSALIKELNVSSRAKERD